MNGDKVHGSWYKESHLSWAVPLLIIVTLILAITNPSEKDHRAALARSAEVCIAKECFLVRLLFHPDPDLANLGILNAPIEYHNYILMSVTTCDGKIASVGFLCNVIASKFE